METLKSIRRRIKDLDILRELTDEIATRRMAKRADCWRNMEPIQFLTCALFIDFVAQSNLR